MHCAQGVSRSASVLIGYLMSREGLSYEAALAQLQGARPCVAPNPGFALQLQEFARSGCCLEAWQASGGWDAQRLDDCFAQVRPSACGPGGWGAHSHSTHHADQQQQQPGLTVCAAR